jgi:glycosyltransferase involved in cell wall biosynthesis
MIMESHPVEAMTPSWQPLRSIPIAGRPLKLAFVITSMPIGGAETLLVNLIRGLDRERFQPSVVCLKELGPLGEDIAKEVPVAHSLIGSKYDVGVLKRLVSLFRQQQVDAVITVGAGDKMFWGRLAAKLAGVRVIGSALHSTGWPDGVGRLNRCLTPITDLFIAVADSHGQFMVDFERFPANKVVVIRNGVDTYRFIANPHHRDPVCLELGINVHSPIVGIVAALRPEKNHWMFIQVAERVLRQVPEAHFIIIGDGPERANIEGWIAQLKLQSNVHLLGSRSDTPQLLAAMDVFLLTSHNEANPVSILEALACEVPVVSTQVGSVAETVRNDETGFTIPPGDVEAASTRIVQLLTNPEQARRLGQNGRELVIRSGSLQSMIDGYQDNIEAIFGSKRR